MSSPRGALLGAGPMRSDPAEPGVGRGREEEDRLAERCPSQVCSPLMPGRGDKL